MRGAILLGCIDGLVIALLGFGVVLVYKADRFVNLANAQLGVVPALLVAKLVLDTGLSWYLAFPLMVGFGVAIGAACRHFVVARLEGASRTSVMIATLGLSQLLLALVFVDWLGPDRVLLRERGYPLPINVLWEFDQLAVTGRHVLTVVLVPIVLVGLAAWLRASAFGRSMRAAASNGNAARLAGIDVRRTAVTTWAIAGGLSVIGAVLTAPSRSVVQLESLSPLLLFLSLGAAALAGFTSLPGVVVAGVALGVVDSVGAYIGDGAGPGLIVVFAVVVLGLLARSYLVTTDPAAVRGERGEDPFRIPEAIAHRWYVQSWATTCVAVTVAVVLPFLPWLSAPHRTFVLASFAVYGVAVMSLVLLTGWAGQLSLGQFGLVGVGAFTAARLAPRGWSLLATIVVAAVFGAGMAVIVGLPSARSRGLSLAVTSLGFAVIAPTWLFTQEWVSPAEVTSVAPAYALGFGRLATQRSVYFVALAVLVLVGLCLVRLRRSNTGRSIVAVRDNERGAATLGFSPFAVRLGAFAVSGAVAAIAGVLWLAVHRNISPETFGPGTSLLLVSAAVIGGLNYVRGAVIGGLIVFGLPLLFEGPLETIIGDSYPLQLFVGGAGVIAAQIVNPGGIASARRRFLQSRLDWLAARARSRTPPPAGRVSESEATPSVRLTRRADLGLEVRDLHVRFGGVHAVDSVGLDVAPGEIVGVIGANGAGKTALLDAICGLVPATGRVIIGGRDAMSLPPARRARVGVSRGFQDAHLFPTLSVRETIELALSRQYPVGAVAAITGAPWARLEQRSLAAEADRIIDRFGLRSYADAPIDRLSTGVRHICEIATQVGTNPQLLILDEPTSGVAQRETEEFAPLIRGVADELGCAVVVVEHDMRLLMSLADRVYCLDRGRVIAVGTPDAIGQDPAVVSSYLGASQRTRTRKKSETVR